MFSVIPKRNSIFVFAVPLYSTLPPTHKTDMPLPLAPPIPAGSCTPAETEAVASLRKTVLDNPHIEFELYGNQFRFRSSDRAGRKFKHKETIELWASGSVWSTIEYTPVNLFVGPPLNCTVGIPFFSVPSPYPVLPPFFLSFSYIIANLRMTHLILIHSLIFIFLSAQCIDIFAAAAPLSKFKIEVLEDRSFDGKEHEPSATRYWQGRLRGRKWISGVSLNISAPLPSSTWTLFLTLIVFYRNCFCDEVFITCCHYHCLWIRQVNIQVFESSRCISSDTV